MDYLWIPLAVGAIYFFVRRSSEWERLWLPLAVGAILLVSFGIPVPISVPEDKTNFVGTWQGDGIDLAIGRDGSLSFKIDRPNGQMYFNRPLVRWEGEQLIAGSGLMSLKLKISESPYSVEDDWRIRVNHIGIGGKRNYRNGIELTKRSDRYIEVSHTYSTDKKSQVSNPRLTEDSLSPESETALQDARANASETAARERRRRGLAWSYFKMSFIAWIFLPLIRYQMKGAIEKGSVSRKEVRRFSWSAPIFLWAAFALHAISIYAETIVTGISFYFSVGVLCFFAYWAIFEKGIKFFFVYVFGMNPFKRLGT